MIDITGKERVQRTALASGRIILKDATIEAMRQGKVKKGNVEEIAKVAGILAAKNTSVMIPMCHQIPLTSVATEMKIEKNYVEARCEVKATYKTGVEMDALSCVTGMLLTIWDMVKYLEKDETGNYKVAEITDVHVLEKRKG
ncbi:MAG: cyclic pyranopterin monophosphate synthase MoaC [Thermoplasmatales archaeon]